jgi:tetratricopeptide (TPR) repeat protein
MITRIGGDGRGDVWRADDLVLETPVALKLIYSDGPDARSQILDEVRLARQITHPAICRVFDVGEAEGAVFYSMELVRGEDLATLLKRVGRLPSEKVVDIGRQLCAGLAAAHAKGVLHRDLRPASILIDNDGLVRITDFGVSIGRKGSSEKGTGSPGYLAPEQRGRGEALSERTDVYALGVVLYELVVGHHPFERAEASSQPIRPSSLVRNVDPHLERVVMQALSPNPAGRPSSAREMGEILAGISARPDLTMMPAARRQLRAQGTLAAAAVAVALAALVLLSFVLRPGGPPLTEQDMIVLADFENTTGDPVFDGSLKVALAVALEQSPFIKVFPDDRARETLRLMNRPPDEPITGPIAREIARREGLKAMLAGSIATLGRNYVLAVEAVNAETGDVMAREQAEAASKEDVLTSLGAATSKLREKLGESLASVKKFDVPLPRATTSSLEALHAYSLALVNGRAVPELRAIPHLKRAIELDPEFAMAQAFLSAVYAQTGQSTLAPELSRKAFELRSRVSERERFVISWRYYRDAIQAWDKALDLARSWTTTYPREAFAFNSLGSALIRLGQYEQAVEPFRESIRLDPLFTPSYGNLGATLMALNRYDEARAVFQEAAERRLDFIGARRISYYLAFIQNDRATMARQLDASVGMQQNNSAFGWQGGASAFEGRLKDAHEQFHRGIQMSLQGNFKEVAAQLTTEDAALHASVGDCAPVRGEVATGLELSRDSITLERASRALAFCGAGAEASNVAAELAKRFPEATLTINVALPITAAMLALGRGQPVRAIELLEPVKPYDHAATAEFWPKYLRGLAYLELKDGPEAAVQFQRILDHRGEVPTSPLFPLAHLGRARAAVIQKDYGQARTAYEAFLDLWKQADPDLVAPREARRELARLPSP